MDGENLYRLMDLIEDLKSVEGIIAAHSRSSGPSDIMLVQYAARKEDLLVRFINELNSSIKADFASQRLSLIKQMMDRFYSYRPTAGKHDEGLDQIQSALSA
jgi:hypothetical protein